MELLHNDTTWLHLAAVLKNALRSRIAGRRKLQFRLLTGSRHPDYEPRSFENRTWRTWETVVAAIEMRGFIRNFEKKWKKSDALVPRRKAHHFGRHNEAWWQIPKSVFTGIKYFLFKNTGIAHEGYRFFVSFPKILLMFSLCVLGSPLSESEPKIHSCQRYRLKRARKEKGNPI